VRLCLHCRCTLLSQPSPFHPRAMPRRIPRKWPKPAKTESSSTRTQEMKQPWKYFPQRNPPLNPNQNKLLFESVGLEIKSSSYTRSSTQNPYKRNRTVGRFRGFVTQTLAFTPFHCSTVVTPLEVNLHHGELEEVVALQFCCTSAPANHHREQPSLPSFRVKALPLQALFKSAPFPSRSLVRIHVVPAPL
jgi:hypothetical protein